MKKLLTLVLTAILAVVACVGLVGCGETDTTKPYEGIKKVADASAIKAGLICLHDETSTYDKNFIDAFNEACNAKGVKNVIIKTGVDEGAACYDAAVDLVDQGCNYIFADSFGHEPYILQAALEYPNVQFCHATGTQAHTAMRGNFHNAFASIFEGRYLAGYAAGLKLLTMTDKAVNNNFKVGYVGAWQYAEVISGYTSWFLGLRAALDENSPMGTPYTATMEVSFTKSWYDFAGEKSTAETLISNGCVLISQHADSMGAPGACETAGVPNVSYNGSTATECPNTYIVSSRINWAPYFEYCFDCMIKGVEIPCDYSKSLDVADFSKGSVCLTPVGTAAAPNTAEKLEEIRAELLDGSRKVFDCSKFTVNGQPLTSYIADVNDAGDYIGETEVVLLSGGTTYFAESLFRSAPYFDLTIDGITLLNSGF